jgi:tyrosyl-tRNA synthetase
VKYLPQFSLNTLDGINDVVAQHTASPEKRIAQRTLAAEMTSLVHGDGAAHDAEVAADILFGADPTSASVEALLAVAREVPCTGVSTTDLDDVFGVLQRCGLVSSTSEARRAVQQKGVKVNGSTLEEGETLAGKGLLHGRWLLVRKGKTSYHLLDLAGTP